MKKILIIALVAMLIITFSASVVLAGSTDVAFVDDFEGVLTTEQYQTLNGRLSAFYDQSGIFVNIVIPESLSPYDEGQDYASEYALDFFEQNGYNDRAVFAHSVSDRKFGLATFGTAMNAFPDSAYEQISDDITPFMQNDDFFGAYTVFIDDCEKFYEMYASGNAYTPPVDITDYLIPIGAGLLLGIIISAAITGAMKRKMNTAVKPRAAANYVRPGSFDLTHSADRFLYQTTTKTPRPKSNSSSGGGSNSRGSSFGGGSSSY